MKASEATPLTIEELKIMKSLLERWVLLRFPYDCGSSEASDARTTYYAIRDDVNAGKDMEPLDDETKDMMKRYGESKTF